MYYHAHCSIAYLACCADMGGIVIPCDSEVKKCSTGHRSGWDMGEKEKWGTGKRKKDQRGIRRGERGKCLPLRTACD